MQPVTQGGDDSTWTQLALFPGGNGDSNSSVHLPKGLRRVSKAYGANSVSDTISSLHTSSDSVFFPQRGLVSTGDGSSNKPFRMVLLLF